MDRIIVMLWSKGGKQDKTGHFRLKEKKASNESNYSEKEVMGQAGFEPATFAV